MHFVETFTVPAPPDEVFEALTDVPLIASCMPGVELHGVDGRRHRGSLRSRLGPISLTYHGEAWFEEQAADLRSFRVQATGSEAGGGGNAGAVIEGRLEPAADGGTAVELGVDLQIAGRPAQFGRGLISDVSRQLTKEFSNRLAARLVGPPGAEVPGAVAGRDVPSAWTFLPERLRLVAVGVAAFAAGVLVGGVLGERRRFRHRQGD